MMGCVYWQLNDRWPTASSSSIDSAGRWKALHYFAARFFAPLLISGEENLADSSIAVHVSNHRPDAVRAEVRWRITDTTGRALASGKAPCQIDSQSGAMVTRIDCQAIRRRDDEHLAALEDRAGD